MAINPIGNAVSPTGSISTIDANIFRAGGSPDLPNGSLPVSLTESHSTDSSFGDVFTNLLHSINDDQKQVDTSLQDLIMGESDGVHNVVISMAQADLSFRFLLEMRNQITEAYQEISRMQV